MSSEDYRPDREINYKALTRLTIGLVLLVVVAFILMWRLTSFLHEREIAQDPPPPLLLEARKPHLPPNPRLQADPMRDLADWKAIERSHLSSYGWSDEARGLAHIPIERAMDLVVEKGLPETPAMETQPTPEPES